jgi:hypothetical protein
MTAQADLEQRAQVLELPKERADTVDLGAWHTFTAAERDRYEALARVAVDFHADALDDAFVTGFDVGYDAALDTHQEDDEAA